MLHKCIHTPLHTRTFRSLLLRGLPAHQGALEVIYAVNRLRGVEHAGHDDEVHLALDVGHGHTVHTYVIKIEM